MTIGSTQQRLVFLCDGVSTVFPVTIQAYLATDFEVILTAPASLGGAETVLGLNSAYTLAQSGSLSPTYWTMTTVVSGVPTAYPAGYQLQILCSPVQNQQTQYVQGQAFPSLAVQTNFDRLTQMVQRLQDQVNRSIRAPDGDVGPAMLLPIAAARANLAPAFDGNGNVSLTGIPTLAFTQPIFNTFLALSPPYAQTGFELAAGIVPANFSYPPGWVQRYGANNDSGGTSNQTPFQNALTACAGNCPVIVQPLSPAGYFGGFTAPVTVPSGSHVVLRDGAELRWAMTSLTGPTWLGSATRPGLNITGGNVRIEGKGILSGPSGAGVYTSQEMGIICVGTSAAAPITGIYISEQIEIRWWGSDGIAFKWVNDFAVLGSVIHDCGYAGMHALTCTRGAFQRNEVYNITPGTSGNAYGFSGTYDSNAGAPTNSRSDPNHFCIGVDVGHNFIHDIPLWLGIDFHGAFDCDVHDNRVYNCWTAIQVASAGGTLYAGENNSVVNNVCDIAQYNGSATTVVNPAPMGITVNGGAAGAGQYHVGVRVIGNEIVGYGNPSGNSYSIQASFTDSAVIADNIIRNWAGYGIYTASSIGGVISNNVFTALSGSSTANDACIYVNTVTTPWIVEGNMHRVASGTAAHFGCTILASSVPAMLMRDNDFASAQTAPYGNGVGGALINSLFLPSDAPPGWNGVTPPTQVTGAGTPTGGSLTANFPGASATLAQTSAQVAELTLILKGLGLVGT